MKILSIDLGTTGCKAGIFDLNDLLLIGETYVEYPLIILSSKEIEQDANLWWNLVKKIIRETIQKTRINVGEIKAIGISSQGISFVPVDRNLEPIYNVISWLDTRAEQEVKQIEEKISFKEIFKQTGKRINTAYILPKLIWLKKNRRHIFDRAYKFLMGLDFIIGKLTGIPVTDHSMASGTLLYDIHKQGWSEELLNEFEIPIEKLPRIQWGGEFVGYVKENVAEELGLKKETMVFTGGQDQKCGAFGVGNISDSNIISISFGTAIAISKATAVPLIDPFMQIPCFSYLIPGEYILEGVVGTGGNCLNWIKNILSIQSYKELINEGLKKRENKKLFFYPHLGGATSPYWKENITGVLYGITLATTKSDIICSIIEGLAFQVRKNIETIEKLTGKAKNIVFFGGGTKENLIRKIFTNVLGRPVYVSPYPDMPLIGASMLAGVAVGFKDYKEVALQMFKRGHLVEPEPNESEMYQELYLEYLQIQKDKIIGGG